VWRATDADLTLNRYRYPNKPLLITCVHLSGVSKGTPVTGDPVHALSRGKLASVGEIERLPEEFSRVTSLIGDARARSLAKPTRCTNPEARFLSDTPCFKRRPRRRRRRQPYPPIIRSRLQPFAADSLQDWRMRGTEREGDIVGGSRWAPTTSWPRTSSDIRCYTHGTRHEEYVQDATVQDVQSLSGKPDFWNPFL